MTDQGAVGEEGAVGELVRSAGELSAGGNDLHGRSLVRARHAVARWANPEGGVAWRRDLGLAHYRPVIAGDATVVVWPGRAAAWGTAHDRVAAVDAVTGDIMWEYDVDVGLEPASGAAYEATGLIADDNWVEVAGVVDPARRASVKPEGHKLLLRAADLSTGRVRWDAEFEGTLYGGLAVSAPDLVLVSCREPAAHRAVVVAINTLDGHVRWSVPHPAEAGITRSLEPRGESPPVVPLLRPWGWAREAWACDRLTGALRWSRAPQELFGQQRDDPDRYRIWAQANTEDAVLVLAALIEEFPPSGRWPVRETILSELDLSTGFVRWNVLWDRKLSDVLGVDDELVVIHHGDGFEAVERTSGRRVWSAPAPIDVYFLKPVLAGGVLLHRQGSDLVLRDRSTGVTRWRVRLGEEADPAHVSPPLLVAGKVVCRVNAELVAVDLPTPYRLLGQGQLSRP